MVTVPHIMVGLERMLDYRGVGLCMYVHGCRQCVVVLFTFAGGRVVNVGSALHQLVRLLTLPDNLEIWKQIQSGFVGLYMDDIA